MTKVRIIAVGDNLLHSHVYKTCRKENGEYDFDPLYKHILYVIQKADIAAVNQETIFVEDKKDYGSFPFFGTPPQVGDALMNAGFNVVTTATNHVMDKKASALKYTMNYWKENYPETILLGINDSKQEAEKTRFLEKNGIKFAMFNYTRLTNYHPRPTFAPYMINLLKPRYKNKIKEEITKARSNADVIMVFVHWGIEYEHNVCEQQLMWTEFFKNCGVDVVIGTHPHVVQPVTEVATERGKMVVFNSLGNFISGQMKLQRIIGGMADITIAKDNGNISIEKSEMIPIITHVDKNKSLYRVYTLEDYPKELANENYVLALEESNITKEDLIEMYHKMLAGEIMGEPKSKLDNLKAVTRALTKNKSK